MSKSKFKELTVDEMLARLEKPKSMRYIRRLVKPIFEETRAKFGDAIVDIVEREHWGPNFDAYYDVWVRRRQPEIKAFISEKMHALQPELCVFVLAQVKTTDDYSDHFNKHVRALSNAIQRSRNGKVMGHQPA